MADNAETTSEAHAIWRDKVSRYVKIGDRGREPCFVGRDDLFDLVDDMIASSEDEPSSRTIVISGAPGAGKSAFLRELAHRKVHSEDVLVVDLSPAQCTPLGVFERIAEALGIALQGESEQARGARGTAKLLGSGGEVHDWRQRPASDAAMIQARRSFPWELMRERFSKALAGQAVVLLCDEAQTLNANNGLVRDTVLALHSGDPDRENPLRIIPVFAGLSDTEKTLTACGVTRKTYGNNKPLVPLTHGESKSYTLRVLMHLDAEASSGAREQWAEWAAANGDGWPHHLRGQMEAVAEEMLRADMPRLQALDAKRIADGVSERRNTYYEDRIGGTDLPRFQDVFAVLAASAERLGGADIDTLGDEAENCMVGVMPALTSRGKALPGAALMPFADVVRHRA